MKLRLNLMKFGLVIVAFGLFLVGGMPSASAAELSREQVIDLMISITKKGSEWSCNGYVPCSHLDERKFRFDQKYGDLIVRYLDASITSVKIKNKEEAEVRLSQQGRRGWQIRWTTFRSFKETGVFPVWGDCLVASPGEVNCTLEFVVGNEIDTYELSWRKK